MSFDVLFFEVRGRRCALPIAVVREVLATPPVTVVPLSPASLRGLVPVHGQVLPLLDVGQQIAPGSDSAGAQSRGDGERIVVIEAPMRSGATDDVPGAGRPIAVRAALFVNRVTRLGTVDEAHARPPPPGPAFLRATVLDVEGPALLIDASAALEGLRQALLQTVTS